MLRSSPSIGILINPLQVSLISASCYYYVSQTLAKLSTAYGNMDLHPHLCNLILSFLHGGIPSQIFIVIYISSRQASRYRTFSYLISLFTADLPKSSIYLNPIKILQYADDLILYTPT